MKVTSENGVKPSRYFAAGAPKSCFLPGCRKAFGPTCFRGTDDHYYCSEKCAVIGRSADLLKVQPFRPKQA